MIDYNSTRGAACLRYRKNKKYNMLAYLSVFRAYSYRRYAVDV
jgi:hypothetical protein